MIVDELIEYVKKDSEKRVIKDIRVGIGYVATLLDDNSCGLAFIFRNELGPKCGHLDNAGELKGAKCSDIIDWAIDINLVKASIGISVINAILQKDLKGYKKIDALKEIEIKCEDTVGVIGYFKPVLDEKKQFAKKIYVFERNITDEKLLLPDWAEDMYLPLCDVVIITGTTLVNKTIDHILSLSKNAREVLLMGPTTPLCREIFKKHGVTMLAGIKVLNPLKILDIAGEGGGGLNLKSNVEQLCARII